MSDTHRTHLATDEYKGRANTRRKLRTLAERKNKSAKADRTATRAALNETRKEFR